MTRSIRVAAVQLPAHDRAAFPGAAETILAATQEACAGAELVVLPEGCFPAYVLGSASNYDELAVTAVIDRLRELAKRTSTVIVAGTVVRDGGGLRNSAIAIDRDGSLPGRADKLFLWHFDRRWFDAGTHIAPVATAVGSLGLLVCADGRIPTIARALVDAGAEMLVMPTAWVTSGRDPQHLENVQADLLARVRAFENGVPFVAANKCGAELGIVAYCGKSQVVGADGEIVAIGSEQRAEIVKGVVTTGLARPHRCVLAQPTPRAPAGAHPVRIAISHEPLPDDARRYLDMLDDAAAIAPSDGRRLAELDRLLAAASVTDETVLDPAGLVAYRRAGYRLAVWETAMVPPWRERLARARAIELRMYVVVLGARRAFAVDPDGTIVAGTFGEYRIASFSFDPHSAAATQVAPGTDVIDGIERVAAVVRSSTAAPRSESFSS